MTSETRASRFLPRLTDVRTFYESDVVIDSFNQWFAGQWHFQVAPDLPGLGSSEDYLCHLLGLAAEHHLLDFGCGVGVTACRLAQQVGCRVRGLNISAKQVALANGLSQRLGLQTAAFDLYPGVELPYGEATFERALFFESVCQVPHKELLFAELLRVLKPGGALAGQDWMLATDDISDEDYERYIRPIEVSVEVALLSLDGYKEQMARAGFTNIRGVDAREIAPGLGGAFVHGSQAPVRVAQSEAEAERLRKGDLALSNAFHRGLFTIGFVYGEKPAAASTVAPSVSEPRRCRLVSVEEYDEELYSIPRNLACLELHRAAFAVPESDALAAFRRLAAASEGCTLESSCKVEGESTHAARWNLFYHGPDKEPFLAAVRSFFREVAERHRLTLDDGLVERFLAGSLDFAQVRKVVTGLDLRSDPARSRLKLWFMLARAPELVERAIGLHGDAETVNALRLHDDQFLVGFDLRFDGTSGIKLYPDVTPAELAQTDTRQRLGRVLSAPALEAMDRCLWTHVYIARHNAETILQLHPADPDEFVARYLPESGCREIHSVYAGARLLDMVVSLPQSELAQGPARDYALYYMPAHVPPSPAAIGSQQPAPGQEDEP
jgi:LynF/TruF/PatF family peptide O-prenyltransferase